MSYDVLSNPTVAACADSNSEEELVAALAEVGITTPYPEAFALGVLRGAVRDLRSARRGEVTDVRAS